MTRGHGTKQSHMQSHETRTGSPKSVSSARLPSHSAASGTTLFQKSLLLLLITSAASHTYKTRQPVPDTATNGSLPPLPCLKACRGQGFPSVFFILSVQCRSHAVRRWISVGLLGFVGQCHCPREVVVDYDFDFSSAISSE